MQYEDRVQCPCSRIDTPLGDYVNVTITFHQLCSSYFVSQSWIDHSYHVNVSFIWPMNARTIISAHAQLFRSMCNLSQSIIDDALLGLSSTFLINTEIVSLYFLATEANTRVDQPLITTASFLSLQLVTIRRVNNDNQLISDLGTNSIATLPTIGMAAYHMLIVSSPVYYRASSLNADCACSTQQMCSLPIAIYPNELTVNESIRTNGFINHFIVGSNSSVLVPGLIYFK
ncbi:unnamed protein product [Rotaria magnacalcarata]|uniref:Uncharacterized protein n=1 Tax=Rotaria magnacalcarata TaxID=392030 RepID=A0A816RTP0_9BILA|nr:unnamed protein product [Rotaria magnacalcarata]CAF2124412.1 unnamed protein product [Rotaria magnacalcarata]CAF3875727.1 unnamed protein product [Rotaria magnacalcarata]CAF3930126.1 unnamed protein product [Rotaria magnacalcarata]